MLQAPADPYRTAARYPYHGDGIIELPVGVTRARGAIESALAGDWDLLVVDEAHHLAWDEGAASPEYQAVAELAAAVPGLLLLTATPEQLGQSGHFARLRLLDPDRFYDLAAFRAEEAEYQPTADAADLLLSDMPLPAAARERLAAVLDDPESLDQLAGEAQLAPEDRESLIRPEPRIPAQQELAPGLPTRVDGEHHPTLDVLELELFLPE